MDSSINLKDYDYVIDLMFPYESAREAKRMFGDFDYKAKMDRFVTIDDIDKFREYLDEKDIDYNYTTNDYAIVCFKF